MWKNNDVFANCCRLSCCDLWQHLLVAASSAVVTLHEHLQRIDLQMASQLLSNRKERRHRECARNDDAKLTKAFTRGLQAQAFFFHIKMHLFCLSVHLL